MTPFIKKFSKNECLKTLRGHFHSIDTLKLMKNGFLLSASRDKTIRTWNICTGVCLHVLDAHNDSIYSIELTQDNKHLITSSLDENLKVWDLATKVCINTFRESFCIFTILLVDNERLACGLENGHIKIRNFRDNSGKNIVKLLNGHAQIVRALQLLNTDYLISASDDGTIKLWDLENGYCVKTYLGHADSVCDIKIMKNGNLASCSSDKTVKVWNLAENQCLDTLIGHDSTIHSINIMPNGNLISCSKVRCLNLYAFKISLVFDNSIA